MIPNVYGVSFLRLWKCKIDFVYGWIFDIHIVHGYFSVWTLSIVGNIEYFKWVNCMVCELYFNKAYHSTYVYLFDITFRFKLTSTPIEFHRIKELYLIKVFYPLSLISNKLFLFFLCFNCWFQYSAWEKSIYNYWFIPQRWIWSSQNSPVEHINYTSFISTSRKGFFKNLVVN